MNQWTKEDVSRLRNLAEQGLPAAQIACVLKRTESSVRNKAGLHGISLRRALKPVTSQVEE